MHASSLILTVQPRNQARTPTQRQEGRRGQDTQVLDARTITTMPAFTAGGRFGHFALRLRRSHPNGARLFQLARRTAHTVAVGRGVIRFSGLPG
jgi:hypothetical protein